MKPNLQDLKDTIKELEKSRAHYQRYVELEPNIEEIIASAGDHKGSWEIYGEAKAELKKLVGYKSPNKILSYTWAYDIVMGELADRMEL